MEEDRSVIGGRKGGLVKSAAKTKSSRENWKGKPIVPAVFIDHRKTFTTSLEVSRVFGKNHKHVLRDIEKLSNLDEFWRSNFGPSNYTDDRGKTQKMFNLSRDGLVFLVMGYTGPTADKVKIAYIAEFNRMERRIKQNPAVPTDPSWKEQRELTKPGRKQQTDTIKVFIEYAVNQGADPAGAKWYYSNLSRMENACLFDLEEKYKNVRNVLDLQQLMYIAVADRVVDKCLQEMMAQGIHYEQIYEEAKKRVQNLATSLGKTIVPAGLNQPTKQERLEI